MSTTDNDSGNRIAVIDDEPEIGDIIRRALQRSYDLDIFETADEAISSFEAGNRYDAILCDLYMPDVSGREIYDELQERWPDQAQRLVFMSGISSESARTDMLKDLDAPMLEKPFRLTELRDAVGDVVQQ